MWLAPSASVLQNGALGNTSSIEEAEYELIELETENDVSLFISWSMILFVAFFFLFWAVDEEIKRKHILLSWVADQSTGFLARSRVTP